MHSGVWFDFEEERTKRSSKKPKKRKNKKLWRGKWIDERIRGKESEIRGGEEG
jgi:hypothetical protein